jgi:hypothetical protein
LPFGGKEQPAKSRLDAEDGEIVAGDARNDAMVAAVIGGEAGESQPVGDDVGEGSGLVAELDIIGVGEFLQGMIAGLLEAEDGELLGSGDRQGTQQEAVNDAEDGGVYGDAQGERHDGESSEPGRRAQSAESVTQILPETLHVGTSKDFSSELWSNCIS